MKRSEGEKKATSIIWREYFLVLSSTRFQIITFRDDIDRINNSTVTDLALSHTLNSHTCTIHASVDR